MNELLIRSASESHTIRNGLETYLSVISERDSLAAQVETLARELEAERATSTRLKKAVGDLINWLAKAPGILTDVAPDAAIIEPAAEPQTMREAVVSDIKENLAGPTPEESGKFAEIWGGTLMKDAGK